MGINQFIVDYSKYTDDYLISKSEDYKLNFVIFSDNFTPLKFSLFLRLGKKLDEIRFTKEKDELNKPIAKQNDKKNVAVDGTVTTQNAEHISLSEFLISGQ